MKLCIPTESDRGMDAETAAHFGTAPFFTMVDVGLDEVTVVRNPACGHDPGACHHIDILRAHHVQVVACTGIGRHALEAIEHAGIRVVTPPAARVADILEAVREGRVTPITISYACQGHGHHHRRRQRRRGGRGSTA